MTTALWGAITGTIGTIGTLIQVRHWIVDRAKLEVSANLSIQATNRMAVVLTVNTVNIGRRPLRINQVSVSLKSAGLPIPQGATPERIAAIKKLNEENKAVSSELNIRNGEGAAELSGDGGEKTGLASKERKEVGTLG
jgi:hypothetical protein